MLEATNKVLYLCLVLFLGHTTCFNHRVKYIAKFVKSKTLMNNIIRIQMKVCLLKIPYPGFTQDKGSIENQPFML